MIVWRRWRTPSNSRPASAARSLALGVLALAATACGSGVRLTFVENLPYEEPKVAEVELTANLPGQSGHIADDAGYCGISTTRPTREYTLIGHSSTDATPVLFEVYLQTTLNGVGSMMELDVDYHGPGTYHLGNVEYERGAYFVTTPTPAAAGSPSAKASPKPSAKLSPGSKPSPTPTGGAAGNAPQAPVNPQQGAGAASLFSKPPGVDGVGVLQVGSAPNPFTAGQASQGNGQNWIAAPGTLVINADEKSGHIDLQLSPEQTATDGRAVLLQPSGAAVGRLSGTFQCVVEGQ